MTKDLINILETVKEKITDSSDIVWTKYDNAKELRSELETYIAELQVGNTSCLEKLQILFLPTATLQEHSISNGWTDHYVELSKRFDKLYMGIKNQS